MLMIVTGDLGLVFWLGQTLAQSGCEVLPARNVRQAKLLLREISCEVDVLAIDPALAGASAFARLLRSNNPQTKILELVPGQSAISGAVRWMPAFAGISSMVSSSLEAVINHAGEQIRV